MPQDPISQQLCLGSDLLFHSPFPRSLFTHFLEHHKLVLCTRAPVDLILIPAEIGEGLGSSKEPHRAQSAEMGPTSLIVAHVFILHSRFFTEQMLSKWSLGLNLQGLYV